MTTLDILISIFPAIFAVPFFFFGGLGRVTAKLGNPNMAIGLFGTLLCFSSLAIFTLALSPSGKVAFANYFVLLAMVGIGNFLLLLWEIAQTHLGNRK